MACDTQKRLVCSILAAAVALFAVGCSRSGGASGTGDGDVDPLKDAPADWAALLPWAEQRLQTPPAAVPLPTNPTLAEAQWPIIRLDDRGRLTMAEKRAKRPAAEDEAAVLAEVTDLRTDQRDEHLRVQVMKQATPDGKDALRLDIGGFQVERADVGQIELTVKVPFGKHITLQWSKAGSILVPLQSLEAAFTVRVLTDGFAEWAGPLDDIAIITDGTASGTVIEVQRIAFLPRQNAYPEAVGIERVRLGHDLRSAIYAHCPAELQYKNVTIPPDGRFAVGIGHITGAAQADVPTQFEVLVAAADGEKRIVQAEVRAAEQWQELAASLAEYAGQSVTITLRATSSAADAVAFWANPTIYQSLADPPILVIYLIDTVAAQHIDMYGYDRRTMPRLATMASQGVQFKHMVANSSRTIESIPDLLLSMPVERHGVHHNSTPAPEELVTTADALRAAGFATVSFCTNVNAGPRQGMDQGFDTFIDKIGYYWTTADRTIPLPEVMDWIGRHRDRPMFLYIHTAEPHAPYSPPQGYAGQFDPDYRGRLDGTYNRATTFRHIRDPQAQQRDLQHVRALYDEEILYSDARFGMFLDALAAEKLLDKTSFFVTSDHGEQFLEHGLWEHGLSLHAEEMYVPLIAYGPQFGNGVQVQTPVQLFDVLPTVLNLYDLPAPYELAGRSLLPLLREGDTAADDTLQSRLLFGSNHNYRISQNFREYYAIEGGRWKLLLSVRPVPMGPGGATSRFSLYDLAQDPHETKNLIAEQPETARRLLEALIRWRAQQHPYTVKRDATEIAREHIAELSDLGYVDGLDEPNEPAEPAATQPHRPREPNKDEQP